MAVKLQTSNNEIIAVPRDAVKLCSTINDMLQTLGFDESKADEMEPIPLQKVSSEILRKVLEWCHHHKDDAPKTAEQVKKDEEPGYDIPDWDKQFLQVDQDVLYGLMLAANYLDVKDLLNYCARVVASMIKGQTPEEIRETYNIQDGFPEEVEALDASAVDAEVEVHDDEKVEEVTAADDSAVPMDPTQEDPAASQA